jgi:hypothetical protein
MSPSNMIVLCISLALCLSSVTAFRPLISSRVASVSTSRSQLNMVFMWKDFKKGTEERMGKSVDNIQSQMNTLRARYIHIYIYIYIYIYIFFYI